MPKHQQSLIIIKPDAIQRGLLGEIVHRFERKGLNIVGLKMVQLEGAIIDDHYAHHKDKSFFSAVKRFMTSSPVVLMVVSGFNAIDAIRLIAGPTKGYEADAGSIRGDFALSGQANIVHASDSLESAVAEIKRFFKPEELFSYKRPEHSVLYAEDEQL